MQRLIRSFATLSVFGSIVHLTLPGAAATVSGPFVVPAMRVLFAPTTGDGSGGSAEQTVQIAPAAPITVDDGIVPEASSGDGPPTAVRRPLTRAATLPLTTRPDGSLVPREAAPRSASAPLGASAPIDEALRLGAFDAPDAPVATAPSRAVFDADSPLGALVLRAPVVVVVGGTPAGIAAAIAAARAGADVTLVVTGRMLGGVLTDAMMDQWDLNLSPGGRALQGGIFAEMHARLGDVFSPEDAARAFDEMVAAEPRIRVVRDTTAVGAVVRVTGGLRHLTAVDVRGPAGPARLTGDAFVDATDDADLAAMAGARYDVGRQDTGIDERMQAVTLMFAMSGVDWPALRAAYDESRFGPGGVTDRRAWGFSRLAKTYQPLSNDVFVRDLNFGRLRDGSVTANAIDLCDVDGLSGADRLRGAAVARRESYALVGFLRAHVPGFERARISRFARELYVRETRHVGGLEQLTSGAIWQGKITADAIGLSSYPLDVHAVTTSQAPAFAPVRHVYGIPLGALVPRGFDDLTLASPAISATHLASGSARIVPTTVEEGEAAGVASVDVVRDQTTLPAIVAAPARTAELRRELVAGGAILHTSVRTPAAIAIDEAVTTSHVWDVLRPPG